MRWSGILAACAARRRRGRVRRRRADGRTPAQGTVTAVDAAARKITIDHEDIPGLMEAMTMPFEVAPGVVLEGLEPGTAVDFEVSRAAGGYTVTKLLRAGPAAPR